MILSDVDILRSLDDERLQIAPFNRDQLQPASYDVRLDLSFVVFVPSNHTHIDVREVQPDIARVVVIEWDGFFVVQPGEFVLASTVESIRLPNDLCARVEGKSSLGRIGLQTHSTAGFIDPGFFGQITLELSNIANIPIKLYPGILIAQLCMIQLSSPAWRPYGSPGLRSKYQGQSGATERRA